MNTLDTLLSSRPYLMTQLSERMAKQQEIGLCFVFLILFFFFFSLSYKGHASFTNWFHPDVSDQKGKEFKLVVISLSYLKHQPLSKIMLLKEVYSSLRDVIFLKITES